MKELIEPSHFENLAETFSGTGTIYRSDLHKKPLKQPTFCSHCYSVCSTCCKILIALSLVGILVAMTRVTNTSGDFAFFLENYSYYGKKIFLAKSRKYWPITVTLARMWDYDNCIGNNCHLNATCNEIYAGYECS